MYWAPGFRDSVGTLAAVTPDEHIDAFIDAFVHRHYRARFHIKHHEFLQEMHAQILEKLDPRFVIHLPVLNTKEAALELLKSHTKQRTACFLGHDPEKEIGEYSLTEVIDVIEPQGAAAASIEPGQLVYYKPLLYGGCTQYLLVKDPKRLQRIAASLARPARTKPSRHL